MTLCQEDRLSDGGTLLNPHSACIWVRLREQCQRFQTSININERAVAPNAVCPGRTRVPSSAIGRRFEWCGGDVARRFVGARPSGGSRGGNGDAGRAKCHGLRSSRPNQQPVRRSSSTRDHFPSLGCDAFYRSRQPLRSNSDFEPRRAGERTSRDPTRRHLGPARPDSRRHCGYGGEQPSDRAVDSNSAGSQQPA